MIFKGSRYEYSTIDFIATDPNGGSYPIVFYKFSDLGLINYYEHVYVQGERLDQIAQKYYQRPAFWWYIIEYNPQIKDFLNIQPGTIIRVPRV